ncbi:hypothetical protein [uncultured Psychrobacter sp.]|uniref:hypothetical protein n=1 Tax=uncultured Psychrobacter sp. TaxID=259303 RepID=UPI0034585168
MKMISYWKNPKVIHTDTEMSLIIGKYDHKNENGEGEKALGIHWINYPQSRGVLSPCVIPKGTRNAILSGLLHDAIISKNKIRIEKIAEALEYFNG